MKIDIVNMIQLYFSDGSIDKKEEHRVLLYLVVK